MKRHWSHWSHRYTVWGSCPLFCIKCSQSALLDSVNSETCCAKREVRERHLSGRRTGGHHGWLRFAGPGLMKTDRLLLRKKKYLLTKITTMQINMIHKGGEDLCDCFPHPFIWLPFFVLFPNDAHLSASLTTACPSSYGTPVCRAHTGLHLPGLSLKIPTDYFFWWQSSCCSWGSTFGHLITPPLCHSWSPRSSSSRKGRSPEMQPQQIIASVLHSTETGDNLSSCTRLRGDWATGELFYCLLT